MKYFVLFMKMKYYTLASNSGIGANLRLPFASQGLASGIVSRDLSLGDLSTPLIGLGNNSHSNSATKSLTLNYITEMAANDTDDGIGLGKRLVTNTITDAIFYVFGGNSGGIAYYVGNVLGYIFSCRPDHILGFDCGNAARTLVAAMTLCHKTEIVHHFTKILLQLISHKTIQLIAATRDSEIETLLADKEHIKNARALQFNICT